MNYNQTEAEGSFAMNYDQTEESFTKNYNQTEAKKSFTMNYNQTEFFPPCSLMTCIWIHQVALDKSIDLNYQEVC